MEIQRINIKNMEIKMEKEKTCKIVFSDIDGTLLLFGSPWSINWAEQHNETLKLSEFGNLTF